MTTLAPPARPSGPLAVPTAATPLALVLVFTYVNSTCAGLVTSGLFFAAHAVYGFGPGANYGLGVVVGTTYTVGALLASRLVARARSRVRVVVLRILTVLAAATTLPLLFPGEPAALWGVALVYGPTIATLWPIVQSYLSGGRSGARLRSAVGAFNLTWGVAIVVGFGFVGPFLETAPAVTLAVLGAAQLTSALLLLRFAPAPAAAVADGATSDDPRDLELRRVFQGLLPLTNVLGFALGPHLPQAFAELGLPAASRASFAVVWLLPRAVTFGVLGRWHGWHGRHATAFAGAGLLIVGFGLAFLAPWIDTGRLGLVLEIAGLVQFGIGMAVVYTAAFYYAQAVGRSAVGAGGRHEALLGIGAAVGPMLGLTTSVAVELGVLSASVFAPMLAALCVSLAVALSVRALRA